VLADPAISPAAMTSLRTFCDTRVRCLARTALMPNTRRRRRRDETVELRGVSGGRRGDSSHSTVVGVNTPVGSRRDPVYNFLC